MGRFKVKESHPITLRMDQELYDKLDEFCVESGQTKTVAVERAVKQYIDCYKNEQEILKRQKGLIVVPEIYQINKGIYYEKNKH